MPNTWCKKYPLFGSANKWHGTIFDFPVNVLPTRDNLLLEVVLVLGAGNILEPGKKSAGGRAPEAEIQPCLHTSLLTPPAPLSTVGALAESLLPQARGSGEKQEMPDGNSFHL